MNANLGHGNISPVRRALERLGCPALVPAIGGYANDEAELLAAHLTRFLDSEFAFAFCSGGSEAIECALRHSYALLKQLGRQSSNVVLTQKDSYHGCTLGALTLTGLAGEHEGVEGLLPKFRAELPNWDPNNGAIVSTALRSLLSQKNHHIGVVLLEPVQGLGGMLEANLDDFQSVAALCRQNGLLLLADEVLTGISRTGTPLACDHYGISPDIVVFSKGLGAGLTPISAVGISAEWRQVLDDTQVLVRYGHTSSGNPLSCAIAREVLSEITSCKIEDNVREIGTVIRAEIKRAMPSPRNSGAAVTGLGLCIGAHCSSASQANAWVDACYRRKLRVRAIGKALLLTPPLIINQIEAETLVQRLWEAFTDVQ